MSNLIDVPGQVLSKIQQYLERGAAELHYLRKIIEAGAFRLEPPQNYAALAADLRKWGEFGMLPALNARRTPDRAAVVDEEGELSYQDLDEAVHAVSNIPQLSRASCRGHVEDHFSADAMVERYGPRARLVKERLFISLFK